MTSNLIYFIYIIISKLIKIIMNSFENKILTNMKEYVVVFTVIDILILFIVLFSLSILVEQFMIRN